MQEKNLIIKTVSRGSPLAKAQVVEIKEELKVFFSNINWDTTFIETTGDKNMSQSLRNLEKTDFFTKELDEQVLLKKCCVAIHSAKDLPSPMPKGLSLIALTKGKDPADVLVLKEGMTLESLPRNPTIGTSSYKREDSIRKIIPKALFFDIRGPIETRLDKLNKGLVDGVVVAECALIRLNLESLNRIRLSGDTTPYQGQLAVVAHVDNKETEKIFSCIDVRKTK